MKVVDTSIFIDHFRGHAPATNFFESLKEEAIFSAITETELLTGSQCNLAQTRDYILQFLSKLKKINVDNPIAQLAGDLSREYGKQGLEIGDALIAATALVYKAELLTRNIRDFEKITGLKVRTPY